MARPIGGQLSEAFRATYEEAGVSQEDIAAALDVDQPTVSKWARGMRRPPIDALPITERLCNVKLGTILRRAGYVDDDLDARAMLVADPELTTGNRRVVLRVYDSLRGQPAPSEIARATPATKSVKRSRRSSRS